MPTETNLEKKKKKYFFCVKIFPINRDLKCPSVFVVLDGWYICIYILVSFLCLST